MPLPLAPFFLHIRAVRNSPMPSGTTPRITLSFSRERCGIGAYFGAHSSQASCIHGAHGPRNMIVYTGGDAENRCRPFIH